MATTIPPGYTDRPTVIATGANRRMLAARVLAQEHVIYPRAVRLLLGGRCRVLGRRVMLEDE